MNRSCVDRELCRRATKNRVSACIPQQNSPQLPCPSRPYPKAGVRMARCQVRGLDTGRRVSEWTHEEI